MYIELENTYLLKCIIYVCSCVRIHIFKSPVPGELNHFYIIVVMMNLLSWRDLINAYGFSLFQIYGFR